MLPPPRRHTLLVFTLLTALTACGGGSGSDDARQPDRANPGPPPTQPLPPSQPDSSQLRPVTDPLELEEALKQGLTAGYLALGGTPVLPSAPDLEVGGGDSAPGFSATTLQEAGVDEADVVKYDGEILYAYRPPQYAFNTLDAPAAGLSIAAPEDPTLEAVVRLLRTDPATLSAAPVAEISLDPGLRSIEGMYLSSAGGKKLAVVGEENFIVPWLGFASGFYWTEGYSRVAIYNVSDPTAPNRDWLLEWQGTALGSRRIGDRLYVLSRYSPGLPGLIAYPQSEEEAEANRARIEETPLQALLPTLTVNGATQPLLDPGDCYLSNPEHPSHDELPPSPEATITTITAIDLANPSRPRSVCFTGYSSGFYMASSALYLTAGLPSGDTLIHKFALADDAVSYRGSGEVRGYLGTGNPEFLMGEQEGVLRVVSSLSAGGWQEPVPVPENERDWGEHRLTLLRENAAGGDLDIIAGLPNAERPAPIGKPGEQVYAVRYHGERAYVVTFRQIDPLYVLDLSDPAQPLIAGELEIPGFSSLLQPLGENLLLGVGSEIPAESPAIPGGVKIALFDVSALSAPRTLDEVVIGRRGSYSPAQSDLHAITLLAMGDGHRLALPIVRHATEQAQGDPTSPGYYWEWTDSGLHFFDVDSAGGLQPRGVLIVEQRTAETPYSLSSHYLDRSVLHGDALYYVHDGAVWSSSWTNADALLGPQ